MNYYQLKDDNDTFGVIKTKIDRDTMEQLIKKLKEREPDYYHNRTLVRDIQDDYDENATLIQVKGIHF